MIERYPLSWPTGWTRIPAFQRVPSQFKVSFRVARNELLSELDRLGAWAIILSSNIPLRQDGLPYSSYREPDDPGVAVYFQLGAAIAPKPYALACDRWLTVRDNLRAIGSHVAALRGMERWGVGSVQQAFSGYQALPARPTSQEWWEVLGVSPSAPPDLIKAAYKKLALQHHPDAGGSSDRMAELNRAWEEAQLMVELMAAKHQR